MDLQIDPSDLRTLEPELERLQPWMHPLRFSPDTIVGYFKHHGIDETVCTSSSPPELRARMAQAYADYMSGEPYWVLDRALDLLPAAVTELSFLDIAAATGRFSFGLALRGAGTVQAVEIRQEQVDQARLVQQADVRLRDAPLHFEHVAESADDHSYLTGTQVDVVLSMGLLYHLTDPLAHLSNLSRLARRAVVLRTFAHAWRSDYWLLNLEDESWLTKARSGVSWTPPARDVVRLLIELGFTRVEVLLHPLVRELQEEALREPREGIRPQLKATLVGRARGRAHRRRVAEALRLYQNPSHFTYVALRD